jgi:hypothetical protein
VKSKSQRDFWAGLMFIVTGVVFAWGAQSYNFGTSARPGPGYFPFGLGVLLAVLGAAVLFKALTFETDGGEPVGAIAFRPLIVILGAIVLFGFILPRLGLFISMPILVVLASLAGDQFKVLEAAINAVALTVFSWLVFSVGLGLTIPLWPTFTIGG